MQICVPKVSEFERKQDQQPRHFDRTRDRTSHSSCKPQAALSQCTTRICSMQRCTSLQPSGGTNLQRSSQCCRTVPGLSSSIHLVAGNQTMKLDTRRWDCYEWLLSMQHHVISCNRYGRKLLLWDSMSLLFVGGFLFFTPCSCICCRENKTVCRQCRHSWWIETIMCSPKYDMNIDDISSEKRGKETSRWRSYSFWLDCPWVILIRFCWILLNAKGIQRGQWATTTAYNHHDPTTAYYTNTTVAAAAITRNQKKMKRNGNKMPQMRGPRVCKAKTSAQNHIL